MQEIWIPELLIIIFCLLYLIQPVFKKLIALDGLAWLPLPAFLITLALFPAYGARPELVPLLFYTAVLSGSALYKQNREKAKFRFREKKFILVLPFIVPLICAGGMAFYFTPGEDTALSIRGVTSLKVQDSGNSAGGEYYIRVYSGGSNDPRRPLLVLVPPLAGSQPAVDTVAGELRDRGFTVLSFARRGFDSPAFYVPGDLNDDSASKSERHSAGIVEYFRRLGISAPGTVSAKNNARGRAMEASRKRDLEFLLDWLRQNPRLRKGIRLFDTASRNAVFLAGWDAGGSALILSENLLSRSGARNSGEELKIRGLVAVECPLFSLYREEQEEIPALPAGAKWLQSIRHGFGRWLAERRPKKLTGPEQIPELSLPVLFLVSDRARETEDSAGRYGAILKTYEAARGTAFLASADGAGPFDYSDYPLKYPLLSAVFRGREKPARNKAGNPALTAELITGFASSLLDAGERVTLKNAPLPAGVLLDSR